MRDHVSIVGVLFILYGVLLLVTALPLFSLAALPGIGMLADGEAWAGVGYVVSALLVGVLVEGLAVACLWV
ncbi:MAG TPA: hypothetical protein ENK18_10370, partial [Deltaproteobacteria bacterium]|nr:hypothetical protein [Deltaproteobacteria bacterium]